VLYKVLCKVLCRLSRWVCTQFAWWQPAQVTCLLFIDIHKHNVLRHIIKITSVTLLIGDLVALSWKMAASFWYRRSLAHLGWVLISLLLWRLSVFLLIKSLNFCLWLRSSPSPPPRRLSRCEHIHSKTRWSTQVSNLMSLLTTPQDQHVISVSNCMKGSAIAVV